MAVVNIRDEVEGAVRVDRTTRWGNPFHIGRDGTRDDVIAKYRAWLWTELRARRIAVDDLAALHGCDLACWCAPQACHGDVLVAAARWAAELIEDAQQLATEDSAQDDEIYVDLLIDRRIPALR